MRGKGKILVGVILVLSLFLIVGCGGGGDESTGSGVTTYKTSEYYPLGQGDTWTYSSTGEEIQPAWQETETLTVSGTETINGVEAVKVVKNNGDYDLWTSDDNGITWYLEYHIENGGWSQIEYNPPLNLIPGEVSIGTKHSGSSTMIYTDSRGASMTGTFSFETTVEGVEDVTVPAGTFKDCLKAKMNFSIKDSSGQEVSSGTITIWFAKGVGKVKETCEGTEDGTSYTYTDELMSATVGGVSYPQQ